MRRALRRFVSDPFLRSIAFGIALIAGGFAAFGLGWRGAARTIIVAEQVPYLVSGGLGGVALIIAGAGLISVQASRYWSARERQRLDLILSRAAARLGAQAGGDGEISRVNAPPK